MEPTLSNSFESWSKNTDLKFVKVDSKYADIQITFGEYVLEILNHNNGVPNKKFFLYFWYLRSITPCKDGLILNSSDAVQFACVYPPGDNGGDIHLYGNITWVTDGQMINKPGLPRKRKCQVF